MEHVSHETIILAQIQFAVIAGHDTGCILTTMLKDGQAVIQRQIYIRFADYADYATHGFTSEFCRTLCYRHLTNCFQSCPTTAANSCNDTCHALTVAVAAVILKSKNSHK